METILTIVVILVLLLLFAGAHLIVLFMRKVVNKDIRHSSAFLTFAGASYLTFCGDYHVSNLVFNHYCSDENFVGQFVYERVALPDEMFLKLPETDQERLQHRSSFFINNSTELIDGEKFNALYDYKFSNRSMFFPVGPIYKTETIVKRKTDGKLLGKAVSLTNKKGWFHELDLLWLNMGADCHKYQGNRMNV